MKNQYIYITVCVGWSKVYPSCGDPISKLCKEEEVNITYKNINCDYDKILLIL